MSSFRFKLGKQQQSLAPSQVVERQKAINAISDFQLINVGPNAINAPAGPFKGFFIDADSLKIILSDPTFTGISFWIGKHLDHPGTTDKVLSIYFTGAKPNPAAPPQFDNPGDVYEYVNPCPTACGNLV
ncbi:hypothetical protein KXD93_29405 [Mucilaginibacter sp. BJC16-A38]|uniref:hypothetical protein n=1 Tax=Mucilaginibacter phenanthrenivorans TaxID=1234842 RepID=UPI00215702F5|nr:hypothetical protein [Mucilaginibacter phenanthrenivorans]MCR8561809.1 hypothetical protein [Mucilaginibacter phenanthrenivorans]